MIKPTPPSSPVARQHAASRRGSEETRQTPPTWSQTTRPVRSNIVERFNDANDRRQRDRPDSNQPMGESGRRARIQRGAASIAASIGQRIGNVFHRSDPHPQPPVQQEAQEQTTRLPIYRPWMRGFTLPQFRELTRQERLARGAEATQGSQPSHATAIRNEAASRAPAPSSPDIQNTPVSSRSHGVPPAVPTRQTRIASQIRGFFSSGSAFLPKFHAGTPSRTAPSIGTMPRPTVRGHDERVDDRAEERLLQLQMRRNQELESEQEQALNDLPLIQAQVQEARAASSNPGSGTATNQKLSLAARFPVPEMPPPPSHLRGTPLQKIDSFDTPPPPSMSVADDALRGVGVPVQEMAPSQAGHSEAPKTTEGTLSGQPPVVHATVGNAVESRVPSVVSTQVSSFGPADVGPMQGVQPQPSIQAPDAPMDPMLRYMEEMSTFEQDALLLDPSNFRQGYHAGLAQVSGYRIPQALTAGDSIAAQGFADTQAFFNTLNSHRDTPSTKNSQQPAVAPAFRHGHSYGLTVGELIMPTADKVPTLSEIASIASANPNNSILQPQPQLVEPGAMSSAGAGAGMLPAVASFPNPAVGLQTPPVDAPIVHTWNPPEVQGNQVPGQNAQMQDSRLPPGIVVSTSFQQASPAGTESEATLSNGQSVQRF